MSSCMETQGVGKIVSCHWDFLFTKIFLNTGESRGPTEYIICRGSSLKEK